LPEQVEIVNGEPGLRNPAVRHVVHRASRENDPLAGGSNALKPPPMGTPDRPARSNRITFADNFMNGVLQVGKRRAEHLHDIYDALSAHGSRDAGHVQGVVRREKLIGHAHIPLIPELLKPFSKDDVLVFTR
jgi:hypothetical protein